MQRNSRFIAGEKHRGRVSFTQTRRTDMTLVVARSGPQALMTCYTVGEGLANVTAIVELCHTTSLRFVQPGMLLPGVEETYRQLNFAGIFSAISRIISGAPLRAGYRQVCHCVAKDVECSCTRWRHTRCLESS